jgi:YD repeat-containing protein
VAVAAVAVAVAVSACGGGGGGVARTAAAADHRILFQSLGPDGGDTLFTMAEDGSRVRRLALRIPGSAVSPDWSPDGKRIAFAVGAGDAQSIWIARADGRDARELFHCAGACLNADYPAWSPDGRSVAFTYAAAPATAAGPPSSTSIRTIDLRSGTVRVAVRSKFPRLVDLARWSPTGGQLVVERDRFSPDGSETGSRIEIVADGHSRPITSFGVFGFHPDWSPDGRLISFDTYDLLAFRDQAPGPSNLFTIRPDGSGLRQLTHFPAGGDRVSAATFSPDGGRIAFTYQSAGRRSAATIAAGGGAVHRVPTAFSGPVTHPRLSPG